MNRGLKLIMPEIMTLLQHKKQTDEEKQDWGGRSSGKQNCKASPGQEVKKIIIGGNTKELWKRVQDLTKATFLCATMDNVTAEILNAHHALISTKRTNTATRFPHPLNHTNIGHI